MDGKAAGRIAPVAWVTGGGSGIGLASAKAIGELGYAIAITGRRKDQLDRATAELAKSDIDAQSFAADVSDPAQVKSTAERIALALGPVALLVCSAGTNVSNRWWSDLEPSGFDSVIKTNLGSVVSAIVAVLPAMRAAGSGQVVVISSWAGWRHSQGAGAAYSASKTALGAVVETLNSQEGRNGIRACHVCPGEVDTPILKTRPVPPPQSALDRMLRPEDVGRAVAFVAGSPPSVCINELVISPTWNRSYIGLEETNP
jgi:NAD(P)-dependent dehydrogenase (short-subunit alcohol dehydrogenase family)